MDGKIISFSVFQQGLLFMKNQTMKRKKHITATLLTAQTTRWDLTIFVTIWCSTKSKKVQREHAFAIVDEVDSILIDEARTPLIISGKGDQSTDMYRRANDFAKSLTMVKVAQMDEKKDTEETYDGDYVVDEKAKTATLTQSGVKRQSRFSALKTLWIWKIQHCFIISIRQSRRVV